jgi:hypothetical protein
MIELSHGFSLSFMNVWSCGDDRASISVGGLLDVVWTIVKYSTLTNELLWVSILFTDAIVNM